jgi:hypothetical protein
MADMGLHNVNWDNIDENSTGDYTPVPKGLYTVSVTKAETKLSKARNLMLSYELTVQSGDYAGKIIKNNFLNIGHDKEQPRNIALAELKAMFVAMETPASSNTEDLLHKPFVALIEVSPEVMGTNGKMLKGNDHKASMTMAKAKAAFEAERNAPPPTHSAPPPQAQPDVGGSMPWDS